MFVARLLAVVLVLAGSAKAQQKLANIAYGPDLPAQTLDFYPSARRPAPLVIFVHGGDWSGGDKGGTDRLAGVLNQAGFNVASVNYRLIPKVRIADEAEDVARAGAFLLSNAGRLGIDKRRFALMGHSAGGHLVALVGTDMSYGRRAGLDMSRLAAVIPLDGVFDLSLPAEMAHLHGRANYDAQTFRLLSPIHQIAGGATSGAPAFCIIHEDTTERFVTQADSFTAALRQRERSVQEAVVPGLNHVELFTHFSDPDQPVGRLALACLRRFLQPQG